MVTVFITVFCSHLEKMVTVLFFVVTGKCFVVNGKMVTVVLVF